MRKKNYFSFRLLFVVALLLQAIAAFSQDTIPVKDSLRRYDITDIVIIRPQGPYGITTTKPDSIFQSRYASGTITDLLGENGLTFLKTYGGGSLATTALRGAS